MAKKCKEINSWQDVNERLQSMNALELERKQLTLDLQPRIAELQESLRQLTDPLTEQLNESEQAISAWVLEHKDDFKDSKTKELAAGKIALRSITSVLIADEEKTLKELKKRGFMDCIKETLKPIKTAIKKLLSPADLAKCGCEIVTSESVQITLL